MMDMRIKRRRIHLHGTTEQKYHFFTSLYIQILLAIFSMTSSHTKEILPSFKEQSFLHPMSLLDHFLKEINSKTNLSPDAKQEQILSVCNTLVGRPLLDGALEILDENSATTIRCISTPNRSAHLVRNSTRSKNQKSHYLCLCELPYCSCRSYFERAKVDPKALCKHLIAIKLQSHLTDSMHVENISDEEFASLVTLSLTSD